MPSLPTMEEQSAHLTTKSGAAHQDEVAKQMEAALRRLPMKITINGREYYREKREMTYDEIVEHVYGKVVEAVISITYSWKGPGDLMRQGIIAPGESVEIADGMHISAAYTG